LKNKYLQLPSTDSLAFGASTQCWPSLAESQHYVLGSFKGSLQKWEIEVSLHEKLLALIGLLLPFLVVCPSLHSDDRSHLGGCVAAQQLDSSMSFSFTSANLNSVKG